MHVSYNRYYEKWELRRIQDQDRRGILRRVAVRRQSVGRSLSDPPVRRVAVRRQSVGRSLPGPPVLSRVDTATVTIAMSCVLVIGTRHEL